MSQAVGTLHSTAPRSPAPTAGHDRFSPASTTSLSQIVRDADRDVASLSGYTSDTDSYRIRGADSG